MKIEEGIRKLLVEMALDFVDKTFIPEVLSKTNLGPHLRNKLAKDNLARNELNRLITEFDAAWCWEESEET